MSEITRADAVKLFESFFKENKPPETFVVGGFAKVLDVKKFIDSHMSILKAGKLKGAALLPYYLRIKSLYDFMKANESPVESKEPSPPTTNAPTLF